MLAGMKGPWVVVLLSVSALGVGCSDPTHPTPPSTPTPSTSCDFSIALPQATFDASGGTGSLTVNTGPNCRWSTYSVNEWIKFNPPGTVTGNAPIALAVEANRSFTGRIGVMEIRDTEGAVRAAQEVTQRGAGCLYSITPVTLAFGGYGTSDGSDVGSFQARVHAEPADCRWTVTPTVSWMWFPRFAPASGTGDATISVAVGWNSSSVTRVGDIIIAGLTGVNPDAHLVVTQTSR